MSPGRCLYFSVLHQGKSVGFLFPRITSGFRWAQLNIESATPSPQHKGSEMDLWVLNQSLGHPSPHCKTTVCKLSPLSEWLRKEGEQDGNWKLLEAHAGFQTGLPFQFRSLWNAGEEIVWLPYGLPVPDGEVAYVTPTFCRKTEIKNETWNPSPFPFSHGNRAEKEHRPSFQSIYLVIH